MFRILPSIGRTPPSLPKLRALENSVAREAVRSALFGHAIPPTIGRYRIEQRLGRGAMGSVFAAHDGALDRRVALKLLESSPLSAEGLERLEQRVLAEARAMARLQHPSVVSVYEVGRHDVWVFIAMEHLDGASLREWLRRERPSWRRIVAALAEVGDALAAAHDAGLAHGDVKPDNLRFDAAGRLQILDFGLARSMSATARPVPHDADNALAIEGLGGTPAYAAPERLDGAAADMGSDQFSFFVTVFECLHGCRPFAAQSVPELRLAIAREPKSVTWSGPRALRRIVLRGLSERPRDRFASMHDAVRALRRLLSQRRRLWVLGSCLAATAGFAGFALAEGPQICPSADELEQRLWGERRSAIAEVAAAKGTTAAFDAVAEDLEAYAASWSQAQARACASDDHAVAAAEALACLRQRRAAFERLVERLGSGDAATWERARRVVAEMPPVESCGEDSPILPGPAPPDGDRAADVDAIRQALAVARIDAQTGDLQTALEAVREARAEAETVGYLPLLAEARMDEGKVLADLDRVAEASEALRSAHGDALASGHTRVAANTAVALIYVEGYQLARAPVGHQWAWTAKELLRGSDDAEGLASSLVSNEAAVYYAEGRLEDADAGFAQAIELEHRRPQPDARTLDALKYNRASVAAQLGDFERAAGMHAEVLAQRRRRLGDDHRSVADSLVSLASSERALGRLDDAVTHGREAVRRFELLNGPRSPALHEALMSLGTTYLQLDRLDEAEHELGRAQDNLRGHIDDDHPDMAYVVGMLGIVALRRCDVEEARVRLTDQMRMLERRGGQPRPLAVARHNLADTLIRMQRWEEARLLEEAALAYWSTMGDEAQATYPSVGLAWIELSTGDASRARDAFARELEVRERVAKGDAVHVAEARVGLGRSLVVLDRVAEGKAALERAIEDYDAAPTARDRALRMLAAEWLAEVLGPAERQRARALLQQARDFWQGCDDTTRVAAIDARL